MPQTYARVSLKIKVTEHMELCRAWLSAGPVAWQAVRGAANRGDLGLEGSLVFLFAQDSYWTGGSTEGSHVDLEAGKGAGDLLPSFPISPPMW